MCGWFSLATARDFTFESLSALRLTGVVRAQHFDRENPIEARVVRAIDLTHAATTEQRQDFVRSEARPRREGGCGLDHKHDQRARLLRLSQRNERRELRSSVPTPREM